jgi:predicted unusual protein kinase regulating ubiquinone biosynthesis (AarF/ABC1/UbiB family)
MYREFERTVYEELDYITEAANCKRFQEMFQDDPTIYIPAVYEEYTTRRVLVLEWINGIKINDYAALEAASTDHLEVANQTVQAYFHRFFEEGFFHADPHPGNIFVKRGTPGNGPIIEFVDFGMVGSLTSAMKQSMRELFLSFVTLVGVATGLAPEFNFIDVAAPYTRKFMGIDTEAMGLAAFFGLRLFLRW